MMKKIISITAISLAALFLTVSCHDPIFYMISQEVVQEEGLQGDINSMVEFDNHLYVANGKIYKKTARPSRDTGRENGQWSESSTSGIGSHEFVLFLAKDSTRIYAQTYQFASDNEKSLNLPAAIRFYYSEDGSTWNKINVFSITGQGSSTGDSWGIGRARIFDNKADAAYVNLWNKDETYKVYSLNGASISLYGSAPDDSLGAAGNQFWKTPAICKKDSTYYYSLNSKTLYYGSSTDTSASSTHSVELDCDDIQSIAATNDYLLLGTRKGIARVKLNASGEPESHTTNFSNNAQSLVTGIVPMVFVLDPTKNEGQTDEYASMTVGGVLSSSPDTFDETGLYAYYPSRGVWNRDGD
ncbi:MAG: hypothetical protein IKI90_06205 [Treponema sp.]|nr:hypothetical protein [Treponema sp.]